MSSPTPVTYVFHGHDEPTLKDRLATFCAESLDPASADFNITRLEGKTVQAGEIETAAMSLPFLGAVRLVLVDNLSEATNARALIEMLPEMIPRLPDWARLIFVELNLVDHPQDSQSEHKRKVSRRQMLKRLVNVVENDPRGKVMAFNIPRNLARWLDERASHYGASIEPVAARALAERIGHDLTLVDTELAKLATYTKGERAITVDDVDLMTPFTPEANIFHMVDALGQGNGSVALGLLHQLLDSGDEPLRIFGMIVRQYRLLIQMREHLDSGGTVNSASEALGIQDFIARKLAGQARHTSLEQLERIYTYLLEVDLDIKTGKYEKFGRLEPAAFALDELVARLSGRSSTG